MLAFACATLSAADSRPVFKIGAVLPLTGDLAPNGQDMRDGMMLAIEDNPKTPVDYKLCLEDSQYVPHVTVEATLRLLTLEKTDCLVSLWSNAANIVSPVAERYKTPHFSTAWDTSVMNGRKWTLCYGPGIDKFTEDSIKILREAGCKRVAIAGCVHSISSKVIPYSKELLANKDIAFVSDQLVDPSERDMRGYILKLRESHPDGIFQLFEPPQDEIFNRQCHELGFAPKTATGWLDYYTAEARRYMNGCLYPSDLWAAESFHAKFRKRFAHDFVTDAPHGYDVATMIIKTVDDFYAKNARLPTHEELLKALKAPRELPDLMAGKGRMHENGWLETPFVIRRMVNGKAVDL